MCVRKSFAGNIWNKVTKILSFLLNLLNSFDIHVVSSGIDFGVSVYLVILIWFGDKVCSFMYLVIYMIVRFLGIFDPFGGRLTFVLLICYGDKVDSFMRSCDN